MGVCFFQNGTNIGASAGWGGFTGNNNYVVRYDFTTGASGASAVTLAAACGTLAVLVLFAYLFVGRQQETVSVLMSLGTPARGIRLWLLSGAAVVAGAAAVLLSVSSSSAVKNSRGCAATS